MSTAAETSGPVDALTRALFATEEIVTGIGEDQWNAGTVCGDWNVGELLDHLVAGNYGFTAALGGRDASAEDLDLDRVAAYRHSAAGLLEAFAAPGVLEKLVTVPFGTVPGAVALHLRITEVLVHGWDLARATEQSTDDFPEDVAAMEVAFSRDALQEIPTGESPFDPPQPVAESAPGIDQLAALLGRRS